MQVEFPIQNAELMPSSSIQTAYTPSPMAAQRPEDRPSRPRWQKSTHTHADANARSTNARIAAQYAEETMHDDASIRAEYITVSTAHTAARRVKETMATQHPEGVRPLTLRRSNVDGNFYSHEFDHEEVVETTNEETSQTSSVDEPWKRIFEAPPRRVYPEVPNGSLRERTLPSVRVQEIAEPPQLPNGSLQERSLPSVCVQELVEPPQPPNSFEFWQAQPLDELRRLVMELKQRLELGIAGLMARGSGPTDERFFQRLVD